jgi:hypothetical protein
MKSVFSLTQASKRDLRPGKKGLQIREIIRTHQYSSFYNFISK